MRKYFSTTSRNLCFTLLMLIFGVPALVAQLTVQHELTVHEEDECPTHYSTDYTEQRITTISSTNRNITQDKLRILAYYDSSCLVAYNLNSEEWEQRLYSNIAGRMDTLLHNTCVRDDFGNIEFRAKSVPANILMPDNIDGIYNAAAIAGELKELWQNDFETGGRPHFVIFISGPNTTGARGTATVMDIYHAAQGMVEIIVVKGQQIFTQTFTAVHEGAHGLGGGHPNDGMISEAGRKGYGTHPNGLKSVLQSPTTSATVLHEGSIDTTICVGSFYNGSSDLSYWFAATLEAYIQGSPDFELYASQSSPDVKVDSTVNFFASANWPEVNYEWMRDNVVLSQENFFQFTPSVLDIGTITFQLKGTTSSGKVIQQELSVNVEPSITTGVTDINVPFKVFPNPATTVINIEGSKVSTVGIFNIMGAQVKSCISPIVNVSDLNPGHYLIIIIDADGKCYTSRFSKI